MPREHQRGHRVSDHIQRELSLIVQRELRDPRVGMVTINEVEVSRDLSYADVHVTFLGIDSSTDAALEILNNAAGYLRTQLAARMTTRVTPRLRFHYDKTVVGGQAMSDLIDAARARDSDHR